MKLSRLTDSIKVVRVDGLLSDRRGEASDSEITSVHYRSSDVRPGGIFFAIKGQQTDGHRYIGDAVSKGASVVVAEAGYPVDGVEAVVVRVENTRKALAAAASAFFGDPSEKLFLIGITGTNGKTTTAFLIEHVLQETGIDVGVISTINYRYHGKVYKNPLTTPESLDLQKILADMAGAGVTHVVMEVSSHGVALDRICHCWFDMGIYTNLSQDHLDFHATMEEYWSCKKRFFTDYLTVGPKSAHAVAVINADNARGEELLRAMANFNIVSVGTAASSDVFASNVQFDQYGMRGGIRFAEENIAFRSGLIGRFNLENIMCAAGAALAMNISPQSITQAMASFGNVPGRLERIPDSSGRHVFLDYAHTPDALKNVLSTIKEVIPGRLICVFGCGGDRDRAKRPLMGKIAAELSDFVIITSDNPRTEAPDDIIAGIRKGLAGTACPEFQLSEVETGFTEKGHVVEPDRERAIHLGIRISQPGDTILIAGKGHEDYQIIGRQTFPFDDREKALAALSVLQG